MALRPRIPLLSIGILGAAALLAVLRQSEVSTSAVQEPAPAHRYDREYPAMNYSETPRTDPVARLVERIARGEVELSFEKTDAHGYLRSLLDALDIDVRSQLLVFSTTSAQVTYISPETPRALYFNDDTYVGWPPGAPEIEIAAMDPVLGPVFYTLSQQDGETRFESRMDDCLRCHDSYSLTGGGVPRFLLGSGFTGDQGQQLTHEGWILVDDRTPLEFRWGGWYVTGTHPDQTHMGNWVIHDPAELKDMDLTRTGNLTDLSSRIDTGPYPGGHSDIAALMVIDHQTRVQNIITRVHFDARMTLGEDSDADPGPEARDKIATITEPLVEALLLVDEAELSGPIVGTSGFREAFEKRGPFDSEGRTLRELDMTGRLFRYPCSYLVYSDAFGNLPRPVREYVYGRLGSILAGSDSGGRFANLSAGDRASILAILEDTLPEFAALRGL